MFLVWLSLGFLLGVLAMAIVQAGDRAQEMQEMQEQVDQLDMRQQMAALDASGETEGVVGVGRVRRA